MERKIPFKLSIKPSGELISRVKNIKTDASTKSYKNSDELFDDLGVQLC